MSVMYHCYSVIIDQDISAHEHGREVVDGINDFYKSCIYKLMSNVQLHRSNMFDS